MWFDDMGWLSSRIHYKKVKVKKKTLFSCREKWGYELTKTLRYKHKNMFFVLPVGYVFDGPSYPNWKFLRWLIGDKTLDGPMAAAAMHDSCHSLPARYVNTLGNKMLYIRFDIRKGAKFYSQLLNEWSVKEQTVSKFQSFLQMIGLMILQPVYRIFSSKNGWEKVE